MAYTDPLTGVKSKHAYLAAEKDINERISDGSLREFAVIVCDLNGLKAINDNQGHLAGDNLLKQSEEILKDVPADAEEKTYLLLHVSATKSKVEKNDYFASEIFNRLGLINIAADNSAFDELSLEHIVAADPDYIFVTTQGDDKEAALANVQDLLVNNPAWSQLSAVQNGHYYEIEKELYNSKPNARWGEAYEKLADILYGG